MFVRHCALAVCCLLRGRQAAKRQLLERRHAIRSAIVQGKGDRGVVPIGTGTCMPDSTLVLGVDAPPTEGSVQRTGHGCVLSHVACTHTLHTRLRLDFGFGVRWHVCAEWPCRLCVGRVLPCVQWSV